MNGQGTRTRIHRDKANHQPMQRERMCRYCTETSSVQLAVIIGGLNIDSAKSFSRVMSTLGGVMEYA